MIPSLSFFVAFPILLKKLDFGISMVFSIAIMLVFVTGQIENSFGFGLTIFLLLYLITICIIKPWSAFYIVISTKFIFDSLWSIEIFGINDLKATHLFLVPALLLAAQSM